MKALSLRFSKASKSYEKWAVPQKYTAIRLKELESISGSVLDLGCGTGFMSEDLQNTVGLDIAIGMAKVYRERFGRVVLGDAHNIPFKDRSFDVVLSNFSLHWTDIDRSFPEAIRVSKGLFLCAMPVEGSLPQLGYPFPKVNHVRELLEKKTRIRHFFLEEVPIPFQGWDLVRFFHYTGSSYNPLFKDVIISRKRLEDMVEKIDRPVFRVLFFSCEVIT